MSIYSEPNREPAFPTKCDDGVHYLGMTLRDWFAGMVMQGRFAYGHAVQPLMAEEAYRMADFMLAERKKEKP